MNIYKTTIFTTAAVTLLSMSIAYAHDIDKDGKEYEIEFISLNNSGVEAKAEIKLNGNILTVEIKASGLEPGKPHPQHIHGHNDASIKATCPGFEADVDGDGLVSVGEGLPSYGPIILPLIPFNLVDVEGNLDYKASFTIDPSTLQPLQKRSIVMHGMTAYGQYIPSLPIACGTIE